MKGIDLPERTEDFTADPVELFFDLAYVFAFSQLVGHLVHHPDWEGVGEAALLFGLLWLPWSQFTWAANAVSGNGRIVRILFLVGTVTSVPMAASVSTAFGPGGPVFAISLAIIVVLGLSTLTLAFEAGTDVYRSFVGWAWPNLLALAVIIAGGFVDGSGRKVIWIIAAVIVIGAMVAAGGGEWIVRPGHFAERHGLIVIIALGEVVVAIGIPVVLALEDGEGLPGRTVAALVAAGAFAGLLWWGYFDRPGPAIEHRAEELVDSKEKGRFVRDVYTWAHAPLVAGIILAAAALEEITLHPADDVPGAFRLMLFGGLALWVLAIVDAVWRSFRVVARERLVALVIIGALLGPASSWDGPYLLIVIDLIILATLVVEHIRIER